MQNDSDWTKKYYSDEARAKVDERRPLWSPELQAKVSRQWSDLIADIEAAVDSARGSVERRRAVARGALEGSAGRLHRRRPGRSARA